MNVTKLATAAAVSLLCIACSTPGSRNNDQAQSKPAASTSTASTNSNSGTKEVKSRDGSYTGEVVGTPKAGSKFAKLQIGMHMDEIQNVMNRAPDRSHSYESGKRWIPFYYGSDARRVQALYKGEGCLIVTGGNVWGGAGGELIRIEHDPSGACYQP